MKLIFFVLFALIFSSENCYAIKPDRVYIRKPEQLGLMYKDVEVLTDDNYSIATWFFPTQNRFSNKQIDSLNDGLRLYNPLYTEPMPTIIICNGDAGNMSYFQLHLAESFTARGFNVVAFDWRGFGNSSLFELDHNYLCYTEMLEDYRAVIEAVAKLPEVKQGAVTIMGWSTGSYLSMIEAYRNPLVNAYIGRSTPTSFDDFIPLVMQKRSKSRGQLLIPKEFPEDLMPIFIAPKFTKPIFLINGDQDFRTPLWMSQKILAAIPEGVPKELMVVNGAGHGGNEDPLILAFDLFVERATAFLNHNFKP